MNFTIFGDQDYAKKNKVSWVPAAGHLSFKDVFWLVEWV